ncbi:MAG: sugar ABC transporter permease [Clostridiales bacterium]|nr:sugar ABC transporter permease [Clostridiales bacterium]
MNRYTKNKIVFWLFVAPALIAFIVVVIIPFFMGIYYSMTDWSAIAGEETTFIGLANYKEMFSDVAFRYSFLRTFLFTLFSVISVNIVSLMLALLVTRESKFRNIFRAGFFVPNLIGGLVLGYIWQFIFKSIVPSMGTVFNIPALENLLILAEPNLTLLGVIMAFTWQYAGYIMMIYVAALMNVPQDLVEASQIDGANFWNRLRNIIVPMIAPAFTVTTFLTLVNSFKQFDIIIALTSGGPATLYGDQVVNSTELLAVHIYNVAFTYNRMAEGQARAIIFFLVLSIVSLAQVYYNKKKEVEM